MSQLHRCLTLRQRKKFASNAIPMGIMMTELERSTLFYNSSRVVIPRRLAPCADKYDEKFRTKLFLNSLIR